MVNARAMVSPEDFNDDAREDGSDLRAELHDPAVTVQFMLSGYAFVTFQSRKTGTRYTYGVKKARPGTGPTHLVAVLTGPDQYTYLGCIFRARYYAHGRKSSISPEATSAVAFAWVWQTLTGGKMHDQLAVYHEGRCGRCGRRLTTPRSIEIGLGPTCETKGAL